MSELFCIDIYLKNFSQTIQIYNGFYLIQLLKIEFDLNYKHNYFLISAPMMYLLFQTTILHEENVNL